MKVNWGERFDRIHSEGAGGQARGSRCHRKGGGKMIRQARSCPNFNHGRFNAPARFCPDCGEVLNEEIHIRKCNEEEHAKSRRERDKYCVNCGEQLIQGI